MYVFTIYLASLINQVIRIRLEISKKMFKKRTINIKSINDTQAVNQASQRTVQRNVAQISHPIQPEHAAQQYENRNKMTGEEQVQKEDQEFLHKLERDKKLNALFQELQNKEKQQSKVSQKKFSINSVHQDSGPISKMKQSGKFVPYSKKKINFTFSKNQDLDSKKDQQKVPEIESLAVKKQIKEEKKSSDKEIDDIFRQIQEQNRIQEQKQAENIMKKVAQQPSGNQNNPTFKTTQLIIEDDDPYIQEISKQEFVYKTGQIEQHGMLKVSVDYEGNLSPQLSQQDERGQNFYEEDYEDELIRKTLTRRNYLKLQENNNLNHTKMSHKKQKLFNSILKTSWNEIESKLTSDINTKISKKNQLQQEMKYLEERLLERYSEVDRKKVIHKQLETEHKKLKKVIYFLCYFGDQLSKSGEQTDTFFNDLTSKIIDKIQKLSDKVNIEDFMEKKKNREELKEKYHKGRKRIKGNQNANEEQNVIAELQDEQDDQDGGQFYIDQDDF